jgi:hypothetical protein
MLHLPNAEHVQGISCWLLTDKQSKSFVLLCCADVLQVELPLLPASWLVPGGDAPQAVGCPPTTNKQNNSLVIVCCADVLLWLSSKTGFLFARINV